MVDSISMAKLGQQLGQIILIDIRSVMAFSNNHIPGAINIPQEKLIVNPGKYLNKFDTYYLYCQKGKSSVDVVLILNKQGYKTVNVEGGYERWALMN